MLSSLARYGLIGAVGTAAHYASMALMLLFGVAGLPSTLAGGALGAWVNYLLLRKAYGAEPGSHRRTGPRFILTATLSWVLNGLLFGLLHVSLGVPAWPAQFLVTLLVFSLGFVLNHFWTFGAER